MFLVEMDLRIRPGETPLTDDDITDLIEKVVDELDHLPVAPSVGTCRVGDDITMTVGVVVDDENQFEALRNGAAIISAALHTSVGGGGASPIMPADEELRSSVRSLQPA
jgi:hypothetical protein